MFHSNNSVMGLFRAETYNCKGFLSRYSPFEASTCLKILPFGAYSCSFQADQFQVIRSVCSERYLALLMPVKKCKHVFCEKFRSSLVINMQSFSPNWEGY